MRRSISSNNNFSIVLLLFIIVGAWILLTLFRGTSDFDNVNRNVNLIISDHSQSNLKPSFKLVIDDSVICTLDSMTRSLTNRIENIHLEKGSHKVQVSTLEGKYLLTETVNLENYPKEYVLWITFKAGVSFEEHRQRVIDFCFRKSVDGKDYTQVEKDTIRARCKREVDAELSENNFYEKVEPHFEVSLTDPPELM